jgi:DNA-binding transcriptional ArsR family regulator
MSDLTESQLLESMRAEAEAFLAARGLSLAELVPLHERIYTALVEMWDEAAKNGSGPPAVSDLAERVGVAASTASHSLSKLKRMGRVFPAGSKSRPTWIPIPEKSKP